MHPLMCRLCALLLILGAALSSSHAAIQPVYSDGLDHTASGTISDVLITDSPAHVATTVHFVAPTSVLNLLVQQTSVGDVQAGDFSGADFLNYARGQISGGKISFATLHDSSSFKMTGGNASFITTLDWSKLQFSGGTASHIAVRDGSNAILDAGSASKISDLTVYDRASATISSGQFSSASALGDFNTNQIPAGGHSWLFIQGGDIGTSLGGAGGVVTILGGAVNTILPGDFSTYNLFGGTVNSMSLSPNSIVNIYGFNLVRSAGSISGILANGTPIQASINQSGNAIVNLYNLPGSPNPVPIPEPASMILFGIASVGLGLARKRKHRR
jgi:hypothetical protein